MSSREELQALRLQLEEHKDKARKEMQEAQRHGNDAQSDLEQSRLNVRRLEEEVGVPVTIVRMFPLGRDSLCSQPEGNQS